MITAKQAFDALVSYNPKLTITSCVDYDKEHYVFSATENPNVEDYNAPYFGVNKNTGEVTSFTPGEDFDAFFDAVDNRSVDISQFKHSDSSEYLVHFGILGMKWGVRRFQNKDGSLTPAGRKRYMQTVDTQANEVFNKHLNTDDKIHDERVRFDEWNKAYNDWYFNEDRSREPSLRERKNKLEDEDPYFEIIDELERNVKELYPNLGSRELEYVQYAMDKVFDRKIWSPALDVPKKPSASRVSFETVKTEEYQSKLHSLMDKNDKRLDQLKKKVDKLETEYLNIAEDDSTNHYSPRWRTLRESAENRLDAAEQELRRYVLNSR